MYAKIENNIVTYITPYAEEGCVEVPEGTVPSQIRQSDGTFINPPISFESAMANLRMDRNALLKETDWVVLPDSPIADKTAWENYRTQLRDITNGLTTLADVESVVWPERPVV